jgi:hypothetical protein
MEPDVGQRLANKSGASTRQVRLRLRYVSVWSAAKLSFLYGIGLGLIAGVTLLLVWIILNAFGVFDQLNSILSGTTAGSSSFSQAFGFNQALGVAALLGPLNTIGATIAGSLGAALYNLGVRMTGGISLGFRSERESAGSSD